jgi:hypothetical protein
MNERIIKHEFILWPGDVVRPAHRNPSLHDDVTGVVLQCDLTVRTASGNTVERAYVQWFASNGEFGKQEWHETWTLEHGENP